MKNIYYDTKNPGSFGGAESLFREAQKADPNIKLKDVKKWLEGELTYTLHKPLRRRFKRNPVIAEFPKELMMVDLVDMREFSRENDGHNYILTAIDVFSKLAFAVALKNKSMNSVRNGMEIILKQYSPLKLMTDNGTEFKNKVFVDLMKKYNIFHYFSKNKDIKCSVVERLNRTLKNRMFRYFTSKGNRRYLDVLDDLVKAYNESYHRSIKMAPVHVSNNNAKIVFKNLYGFESKREYLRKMKRPRLTQDDTVRRKYDLNIHDRGYYPNWTDEIYKVYKTISGLNKPYYKLKHESGNVIEKRFYPEEVQKVKPTLY